MVIAAVANMCCDGSCLGIRNPPTLTPELHMAKSDNSAKMPSHVDERPSLFDRFATYTSERVSRAWFFGVCALLVLIWVPTFWLWRSIDGWALVINTLTSTVTFLLVALLQNTETRRERDSTQAQCTGRGPRGPHGRPRCRESRFAPLARRTDRSGGGRTSGKHEVRVDEGWVALRIGFDCV